MKQYELKTSFSCTRDENWILGNYQVFYKNGRPKLIINNHACFETMHKLTLTMVGIIDGVKVTSVSCVG